MATDSRKNLIDLIQALLHGLFCYEAEEIQRYEKSLQSFDEETLKKFLTMLMAAKKQQDELFGTFAKNDPDFQKDLSIFLRHSTSTIKQNYENKQSESADAILDEL